MWRFEVRTSNEEIDDFVDKIQILCSSRRMSKDDLTQVCGLADGIRMFNILHVK